METGKTLWPPRCLLGAGTFLPGSRWAWWHWRQISLSRRLRIGAGTLTLSSPGLPTSSGARSSAASPAVLSEEAWLSHSKEPAELSEVVRALAVTSSWH